MRLRKSSPQKKRTAVADRPFYSPSRELPTRRIYFLNVSFKPVVLLNTAFSGVESLSATK